MKDIYAEITNNITEQLEQGIIPWQKPWCSIRHAGAISHNTGRPYSLINQLMLGKPGEYITWNQCHNEGGHVKKGAKSHTVVFWKMFKKTVADEHGKPVTDDEGNETVKFIPILKYYSVFHIDDCEGIEKKWNDALPEYPAEPDEEAEDIFHSYLNREHIMFVEEESNDAYYFPLFDTIHLPLREQFTNTAEYYSTAFHEAVHSTGHENRLNRLTTGAAAAFGKEDYSQEELVAEIGAACILRDIGIDTASSLKNSAAYIQAWLKKLKNDKKLIVMAASRAEKAVKLILNEQ